MRVIKQLLGTAAFLGVCSLADAAKADYVCRANFSPATSVNKGNSGYVQFTTYTGPDCTGAFITVFNLCSSGATSSGCIENTQFHLTTTELLAQWDALRLAVSSNVRVSVPGSICIGGVGFCVGYLEFHAN